MKTFLLLFLAASAAAQQQIGTNQIQNSAITTPKIANGAVDTTKLGSGAVDTGKILLGAVGTNALQNLAVTTAKIAAGAVDTTKLGSGAVDTGKILFAAVGTNALQDGAVDTNKLGSGAVDTGKILRGAVTTNALAASAVDTTKLGSGAVDTGKINAIGSPSATTFLRGDMSWATPATTAVGVSSTSVLFFTGDTYTNTVYSVAKSSLTVTTSGGDVWLWFRGDAASGTLNDGCMVWMLQDGQYVNGTTGGNGVLSGDSEVANGVFNLSGGLLISTTPSAGTHTYAIGFGAVGGGTCSIGSSVRPQHGVKEIR